MTTSDKNAWLSRAACKDRDTNIFFGADVFRAKQFCGQCPVARACLQDCLEYERSVGRRDGVYGNTTPQERDRIEGVRYHQTTDVSSYWRQ